MTCVKKFIECRELRVWKLANRPFVFGGSCKERVAAKINVPEKDIVSYKGIELAVVAKNGKTFVFDVFSGGMVGNSLEQVKQDIDVCDDMDYLRKQLETNKIIGETAKEIPTEIFFS